MKYIRKLVLLVLIFCLAQVKLPVVAEAKEQEVTSYNSISDIPTVLSGVSKITFKPNHPAYKQGGRNKLLGQIVVKDCDCLITFSIPEIEGLSNCDLENYNLMAPKAEEKRLLMITVEYYEAKIDETTAESRFIVFNPTEDPELTLSIRPGNISARMDPIVADVSLFSSKATTYKIWTDDYTKKPTKTTVYQSSGAGMDNYAMFGWGAGGVDDATFSYDYLDLPLRMRRYLAEDMFEYNEYLSKEVGRQKWYQTLSAFWQDKDYAEFDLDAYAKSLGATVQSPPNNACNKEYLIGGHIICIGCFTNPKDDTGQAEAVTRGYSWVYWNEYGVKDKDKTADFETYSYERREGEESEVVKVDSSHYVSRCDFDYLASLLAYCATR